MLNMQKNTSKKVTLDTVMEEADSHTSDLQTGGVKEEGMARAETRGEDTENVPDGLGDGQYLEGDDKDGEDKDYIRDGYHYDHDPSLLRVTKDLEATQAELAEHKKLTTKMKKMMERLQSKFGELAESDGEPSVEVVAKQRTLKQTEARTLNPPKDKGKGKAGKPSQKPTPRPPLKDNTTVGQPLKAEKATGAFEPRRPSDSRGKATP
uniref:Uncharacterized protein n=1 Tax=Cannabis sativa TaxID=3483 RepID=A0A803NNI4_CANSA